MSGSAMTINHDVESAFLKGQIGYQSAFATAVAATVRLGSVTLTPSIKRTTTNFTPRGTLLPTIVTRGREWSEIAFDGKACHEEISLLATQVYALSQVSSTNVYTVEAGGLKMPGCVVTDWTIKGNRDEVTVSGKMIGRKGIFAAPTGNLQVNSGNPLTPITPLGTAITIDGEVYTIAPHSAQVGGVFEWSLSVANMWGGAFFVGSSDMQNIMQKAVDAKFSVKMEADGGSAGTDDASATATAEALLNLAVGATVPVTVVCTDGAKVFTLGFSIQVGEPGSFSDEEGIYALEINGVVMAAATDPAISVTST